MGERPTTTAGAVVGVSDEARRLARTESRVSSAPPPAPKESSDVQDSQDGVEASLDPKLQLLIALVERLTGRRVELIDTSKLQGEGDSSLATGSDAPGAESSAATASEQRSSEGWGIEIQATRTVVEQESTSFAAQGVVLTSDGRRIGFETTLAMEREQVTLESFELRAGDAAAPKDPLVLNFGPGAAQLSGARAPLDLEGDGTLEAVPLVTRQSALLVRDTNANGKLDGGSELFGPTTGNGFSELAALDEDGNQWIDESDSAFTRLGVWFAGDAKITSLATAGVGALYVGSTATPFRLREPDATVAGQVRATGVWLAESGEARTLQQIDLYT